MVEFALEDARTLHKRALRQDARNTATAAVAGGRGGAHPPSKRARTATSSTRGGSSNGRGGSSNGRGGSSNGRGGGGVLAAAGARGRGARAGVVRGAGVSRGAARGAGRGGRGGARGGSDSLKRRHGDVVAAQRDAKRAKQAPRGERAQSRHVLVCDVCLGCIAGDRDEFDKRVNECKSRCGAARPWLIAMLCAQIRRSSLARAHRTSRSDGLMSENTHAIYRTHTRASQHVNCHFMSESKHRKKHRESTKEKEDVKVALAVGSTLPS
jgi:hypothetical protein